MSSPDSGISETTGKKPDAPKGVKIGDFLVGRYTISDWSRFFPWEKWDHAALVTSVHPLKIIEAGGIILQREDEKTGRKEVREGVVEYEFLRPRAIQTLDGEKKPGNLWLMDNLREVLWLRPVFPDPLREIDHWTIPWKKRKVITEARARQRAVTYARLQLGEPFKLSMFKSTKLSASKWDEHEWYCSLLIFKAYSQTVTNMSLESYEPYAGFFVTPEDLVQSRKSMAYHHWFNEKYFPQ